MGSEKGNEVQNAQVTRNMTVMNLIGLEDKLERCEERFEAIHDKPSDAEEVREARERVQGLREQLEKEWGVKEMSEQ